MLSDTQTLGQPCQPFPVRLAATAQHVRVRRAEDEVKHVRVRFYDLGQRPKRRFDALVRRQQPEGQNHPPPVQAECGLTVRPGERNVRYAVVDKVDFSRRHAVNGFVKNS